MGDSRTTSPAARPQTHVLTTPLPGISSRSPGILTLDTSPRFTPGELLFQAQGSGNLHSALVQPGMSVTSYKSPQPFPSMEPQKHPSDPAVWSPATCPIVTCKNKNHSQGEHAGRLLFPCKADHMDGLCSVSERPVSPWGQFHLSDATPDQRFALKIAHPSQQDTCY